MEEHKEARTVEAELDLFRDFDRIYVLYFSRMRRFAEEYILSREDAENVVQDIFTMLWENRTSIIIRSSLTAYLFNLTKNRCLDYLRHQSVAENYKKEQALKLSALEQLNEVVNSDSDVERLIREAIQRLPEKCREIFIKNRFHGKKYREIAAELDLSESTVETQMSIALKRLREDLKDCLPLLVFFLGC